jgi:hypothetical protein
MLAAELRHIKTAYPLSVLIGRKSPDSKPHATRATEGSGRISSFTANFRVAHNSLLRQSFANQIDAEFLFQDR